MIVAITVATVGLLLAVATMAISLSLNDSTTRDKRWHTALVVAESGIQDVLRTYGAQAAITPNSPPLSVGPITNSAAGGVYVTRMDRCTAAGTPAGCPATGWLVANSTGSVATTGATQLKRRVRITYGPEPVFNFALFSAGDLELKNNAVIEGDVFANGNITFGLNNEVTGNVLTTGGWVDMGNGTKVLIDPATGQGGSVFSGGNSGSNFGINVGNGSLIEGDVHAKRECAPAPALPTLTHKIQGGGPSPTVQGSAFGPGAITIAMLDPTRKFLVCEQRGNTATPLPPLRGWASDPSGVTHRQQMADYYCGLGANPSTCTFIKEYTSAATFASAVLSTGVVAPGVYYVDDPTATIVMKNKVITPPVATGDPNLDKLGDFVLRTNAKLDWQNGGDFFNGPGTAVVEILSENTSPCQTGPGDPLPAINIENALQVVSTTPSSPPLPPLPSILFYSKGCIDTKNNGEIPGAVYGSPLKIKNNALVPYDPRIRRIIGAGSNRFSQATWNELRP